MSKVVTIHQPDFMPWRGFFDRWAKSDIFVVLDDVQFIRRGWHHRDRIKTSNGSAWLTVPVKKKGRYEQKINEVEIDNDRNWQRKHLSLIGASYKKAPNFGYLFPLLKDIYDRGQSLLIDLNMDILKLMAAELGITTAVVYSSDYKVQADSSEKLLRLVQQVDGTVYLTGTGASDYLDESIFRQNGITVQWQKFQPPVYRQLHGEFEAKLSALDSLMMKEG
ncbi:WbqC family protein [Planctomycetota bacterium]